MTKERILERIKTCKREIANNKFALSHWCSELKAAVEELCSLDQGELFSEDVLNIFRDGHDCDSIKGGF